MRRPALLARRGAALALAALPASALPAPQGGGCEPPAMDAVPGSHPYGPVDPDDGDVDRIDVASNAPLTLEYAVAGLDHEASLAVSAGYVTLGAYALTTAEVPLPLGTCAPLWLPVTSPTLAVPADTLETPAQLDLPGPVGLTEDVWFQTATVDLATLEIALSDLALLRFHQGPVHPDPTDTVEHGCWYWGTYTWNEGDGVGSVKGRVYWPSPCGDGSTAPPGVLPLVLLTHGDGHAYTDYHYLLRHLAKNGFIAATIEAGQEISNVERAERIRTYLGFLRDHWTYKDYVENSIALMGHSRGGEAVLTAARKLQNDWGTDHDIDAIISLAPTDNDEHGSEGLESLSGLDSEALLVIYGSMDEDVAGYCTAGTAPECGGVPTGPQATGFSLYDRAGGEGSTEGVYLLSHAVTKAMLFVERADHNRWRDQPCTDPAPFDFNPALDCETHHDVLKAYVNAFARWRLRGQDEYRPYFTGEWTPVAVADHGPRILAQYSEGIGRRVIDDFESGPWNDATLGTITHDPQVVVVEKGPLWDDGDYTIPHDTAGMILRWSTVPLAIDPWIRWTIPAGGGLFTTPYRDFSGFSALSLRVGQLHGSGWAAPGEPTNLFVRMRDGSGTWSPKVWVDAFADLSWPHEASVVTPLFHTKTTPKSSLRTARIPLSYFTGIDLTDVVDVDLVFGDDDHTSGEVLIDNLELVP